jgi:hypothetical protein
MRDARREIASGEIRELARQLRAVPENSRKLLARIIELAYRGKGEEHDRRQNTAYLPELHESCGLDVEAMYDALKPLQSAGLIEVKREYPFEEITLVARGPSGGNALAELAGWCNRAKVSMWDVVVDLQWDVLDEA